MRQKSSKENTGAKIDVYRGPKAIIYYDSGPRDRRVAANLIVWSLGLVDRATVLCLSSPFGDDWKAGEISNPRWQRYRRWRQGSGESRCLYDAPGLVTGKGEDSEIGKVIEFALILGRGALVAAEPGRNRLFLSHDDRLEIYRCAKWRGLRRRLTELGYWHARRK